MVSSELKTFELNLVENGNCSQQLRLQDSKIQVKSIKNGSETSQGVLMTTIDDTVTASNLELSGLSTTDPGVIGRVWNDAGTLKISL